MHWFIKVFVHYFDFSQRARRKEFWMFTLFSFLISWGLQILDLIFGLTFFTIVSLIYSLFAFIPSLAVTVRRLHDIGKSGWYFFVAFIPIAGPIWLLILLCMEGESRPNQWGDNPKGVGNDRMINQIGKE